MKSNASQENCLWSWKGSSDLARCFYCHLSGNDTVTISKAHLGIFGGLTITINRFWSLSQTCVSFYLFDAWLSLMKRLLYCIIPAVVPKREQLGDYWTIYCPTQSALEMELLFALIMAKASATHTAVLWVPWNVSASQHGLTSHRTTWLTGCCCSLAGGTWCVTVVPLIKVHQSFISTSAEQSIMTQLSACFFHRTCLFFNRLTSRWIPVNCHPVTHLLPYCTTGISSQPPCICSVETPDPTWPHFA